MVKEHSDIVVLGAGISGLTAAFHARKAGLTVQVIEDSNRPGGVIRSTWKDGYLLEFGPNTILPTVELMELVEELKLTDQMMLADAKSPRFIQYKGTLHRVPMSPSALFKTNLISTLAKARLFLEPFIPANKASNDESISSFFRRRLGNEITENLVGPFVSGVWAGDPERLSIRATFENLVNWEKNHGSLFMGMLKSWKNNKPEVPKAPKGLLNFTNGVETLSNALGEALKDSISYGEVIEEITPPLSPNQVPHWNVRTSNGEYTADHLIFTLPANITAQLVKPFAAGTAWTFSDIPYVPMAVVHLAVPKKNLSLDLNGFGYLVAPSEKSDILGCLWSSSLFPNRAPEGMALLTVLVGGSRQGQNVFLNDNLLVNKVFSSIYPILKFKEFPEVVSVFRYEAAIPQYTLGHPHRVEIFQKAQKSFPGLHFAGNYMGGVGVGNVVQTAKKVIGEILSDRKENTKQFERTPVSHRV